MAQRDLKSKISIVHAVKPAVIKTTATGAAVDLYGYESCTFAFIVGTVTDGTHTPKIQHSDTTTSGDFADVPADEQLGTLAAFETDVIQKCGYIGNKRYVRAVVTITDSPATGAAFGVAVIKGDAARLPV